MPIELRPYQQETRDRMLALYEANPRGKGKFVWATGCGKTIGFSCIACEIHKRTRRNVLIIAHRDELLNQAIGKYRSIDPDALIGKVGGGCQQWGAPITVASIQSLQRSQTLKTLKQFHYGLVIVDECHHAMADNEYGRVLAVLPEAFKIGCTATDDRLDHKTNTDLFGESIYTLSILSAIEQGYLSNVRAIAIETGTSLDGLHSEEGDFATEELAVRVDTPERNRKIVEKYLEHAADRQAMCFSVDVGHATHLAEAFNTRGVRAVAVHGKTPKAERARVLADFERGLYQVICNCQLYTEGYDATTVYDEDNDRYIFLSCAIMARPTRSRALYAQCVGRILRLAPTKTDALVLDATDNTINHRLEPQTLAKVVGLPLFDGETVLDGQQRKRKAAQEAEAHEKQMRTTTIHRQQDLVIDVASRMDWRNQRGGSYLLEVGESKHRILLRPSLQTSGYYSVWAMLAPGFRLQLWEEDCPLDMAQHYAERQANFLKANEKKHLALLDRGAPWRRKPLSEPQKYQLQRFGVPFREDMTCGEAADLLSKLFADEAKSKEEARKARAAQKAAEKGTRARKARA